MGSIMKLGVVILAAGQGTRMKSALPKVLHPLAGQPLLGHVIDAARGLGAARIAVVYGHGGDLVPKAFDQAGVDWVEQAKQLGTGHAVAQAMPSMTEMDRVLVLYGDVPLTSVTTLQALVQAGTDSALALLTVVLENPSGYGRIVRNVEGRVQRIVEQKDAAPDELEIDEINTGIMVVLRASLQRWLEQLDNHNAQGEFYLTDVVAMAVAEGQEVESTQPADSFEVMGVNDRQQLAGLERRYQSLSAQRLMRDGITLRDPNRFDLRGSLHAGTDVEIDINVLLEGEVQLGSGVRVGANTVIRDSRIGDGVQILENCIIEQAEIGDGSRIGPFARIRPETRLAPQVHIGNFVEIKKSRVDQGSKINHLSYVGDSIVGRSVNIGAGTITCNYDGAHKHQTVICDDVFVGSDTQLVAPVKVGTGATIGAGSTITRDVLPGSLALSRVGQTSLENWIRPRKKTEK